MLCDFYYWCRVGAARNSRLRIELLSVGEMCVHGTGSGSWSGILLRGETVKSRQVQRFALNTGTGPGNGENIPSGIIMDKTAEQRLNTRLLSGPGRWHTPTISIAL